MCTDDIPMALYSVEGFNLPPSPEVVAEKLGISPSDIDRAFGVILIDPKRGMYCVQARVDQSKQSEFSSPHIGPWSSPKIEGFG